MDFTKDALGEQSPSPTSSPTARPADGQSAGRGAVVGTLPGQPQRSSSAFESTDDETLKLIVRGGLLNLGLNARDEEVRFKALKELGEQVAITEEAKAKLDLKYGRQASGGGLQQTNILVANEKLARNLITGMRTLLAPPRPVEESDEP